MEKKEEEEEKEKEKKKKGGPEPRNEATYKPGMAGKRVSCRASRKKAALWTLACWLTETIVRLLANRTEQNKSMLSLQHHQDL